MGHAHRRGDCIRCCWFRGLSLIFGRVAGACAGVALLPNPLVLKPLVLLSSLEGAIEENTSRPSEHIAVGPVSTEVNGKDYQ